MIFGPEKETGRGRDGADRSEYMADRTASPAGDPFEAMMASHLPPRKEVHGRQKPKHRKKRKRRLKYPLITLLAFLFIILPLVIIYISLHYDFSPADKNPAGHKDAFEKVDIDPGF
ncbi:MAG: hypothetical protein CW346_05185 [Bacillaceae bacterium]|jgi:hypothetical protein|nr:hypothetical protein [Bacillaceae bacterium]